MVCLSRVSALVLFLALVVLVSIFISGMLLGLVLFSMVECIHLWDRQIVVHLRVQSGDIVGRADD